MNLLIFKNNLELKNQSNKLQIKSKHFKILY